MKKYIVILLMVFFSGCSDEFLGGPDTSDSRPTRDHVNSFFYDDITDQQHIEIFVNYFIKIAFTPEVMQDLEVMSSEAGTERILKISSVAFAKAFGVLYGKPMVEFDSYNKENKQLRCIIKTANRKFNEEAIISMPEAEYEAIVNDTEMRDRVSAHVVLDYQKNILNVKGIYIASRGKRFYGELVNPKFRPMEIRVLERDN